ncbi:MAG: 4Fe-4S dicluster domain-containing protein [Armatimonadota bacterium]
MKGMIVVRAERCLACKSCEIACAVEHSDSKDLVGAIQQEQPPAPRVSVEQGEGFVVPLQCRQCEDAPCVKVCPTHALYRVDQDSPVVLDEDLCIGCKWCILACPFGVIRLDENTRVIIKCDQCIERLQRDEKPACVCSCPTHALEFRTMGDILKEKRKSTLVMIERAMSGEER